MNYKKIKKMRQIIVTVFVLLTSLFSAHSQSSVLNEYYELKEALVNSDVTNASIKATEFSTTLSTMDMKTISGNLQNGFTEIQKKLVADALLIVASKEISKQREYFANLSLSIYSLAKMMKLSNQPIYRDYCPMKKMYWLSDAENIRNPYYGRMMLACGSITETINP